MPLSSPFKASVHIPFIYHHVKFQLKKVHFQLSSFLLLLFQILIQQILPPMLLYQLLQPHLMPLSFLFKDWIPRLFSLYQINFSFLIGHSQQQFSLFLLFKALTQHLLPLRLLYLLLNLHLIVHSSLFEVFIHILFFIHHV